MSLGVRAKIASLMNPSLRLAFAVEKNNVGAIRRELQNGADPNFRTLEGATMLMAAVANGHRETAKALLEGGADPNLPHQFGNTVMDLAADAGDADSVVMLLEYGALTSEKLLERRAQALFGGVQSDAATEEPVVAEDPVRIFAAALGDFVWETDPECNLTYLTGGVADHGNPEKFLGHPPWALPGIDAEEATWAQFRIDMSRQQLVRAAAYRQEMANGGFRFFEITGVPQFGDNGALTGYRGIGREITDWFMRDDNDDTNSEWDAERDKYETLLKQQSEKLENLERASADKPAAGGSAANLKKLLDERADEFQKEQAERKRLEAELAARQDLVEELVDERTAKLRREIENNQTETDKHQRLSGEMAARCDDLKSQVEASAAQLETITAARDMFQASVGEVTGALERETDARQRLGKDLSALTDRLTAMETQHGDALRAEVAAREAAQQELSETKVAMEAAIESKTQFLATMGQQIQNHLGAGAEGTVEPEVNAEDPGGSSKITPLRRTRRGE